MKLLKAILFTCLGFFTANFAFADGHSATELEAMLASGSTWTNQSGSVATLSFSSSSQSGVYTVTGTYVNNAAGYPCQGTPYPLSGVYYTGNQTISFSVAWSNSSQDCQSVTGWTGYFLYNSGWSITTDWNLAQCSHSGPTIIQGQDIFTGN